MYFDGNSAEIMFEQLIAQHKTTFKVVNVNKSSEELVNLGLKYCPRKVQTISTKLGYSLSELKSQSSDWLCDKLFKIDSLLEVELEDLTVRVLVDVTTNPEKIEDKTEEIRHQKKIQQALGIDKALVVLIGSSFSLKSKSASYILAGQLLEAIENNLEWCCLDLDSE